MLIRLPLHTGALGTATPLSNENDCKYSKNSFSCKQETQKENLLVYFYFSIKAGVHVNLSEILVSLKRG